MISAVRKPVFTLVWAFVGIAWTGVAHAGEIDWYSAPRLASLEAQQSGLPLLIYFETDFCGYCRRLERTTWASDAVASVISETFVPLRVDAQVESELARRLGVRGFPTVLVLSPEGQMLERIEGYRDATEMHTLLKEHSEVHVQSGQP